MPEQKCQGSGTLLLTRFTSNFRTQLTTMVCGSRSIRVSKILPYVVILLLTGNSFVRCSASNMVSKNASTLNESVVGDEDAGTPLWQLFMDNSQLVLTVIGTFANIATVMTLVRHEDAFPPIIRGLLTHQGVVDAFACFCAAVLLIGKPMSLVGVYGLDTFICMLWHGQFIYWCAVFVSIYNLVVIASERYLAICHPFKHASFTKGKVNIILIVIYTLCPICTAGAAFQTRINENGTCVSEHFMRGDIIEFMYAVFSVTTLFTFWGIPFFFFVFFYGMVAFSLHRRKQNTEFGSSRAIDNASRQLTKTAIVVTCIFIVALGYDIWYYLLGKFELVVYINNSPLQKIGVWLSAFNSVANPFVYIMMMPSYRKCVLQTFCPCLDDSTKKEKPSGISTLSNSTLSSSVSA